jgi:hypothetical protein
MIHVSRRKRIDDETVGWRPCVIQDNEKFRFTRANRKVVEYGTASAPLRIGEIVIERHAPILA